MSLLWDILSGGGAITIGRVNERTAKYQSTLKEVIEFATVHSRKELEEKIRSDMDFSQSALEHSYEEVKNLLLAPREITGVIFAAFRVADEEGNQIFNPDDRSWLSGIDNHIGVYVAQTIRTVKMEWYDKVIRVNSKTTRQSKLQEALKKYGKDGFEIRILDICYSEEELNIKEIFWIHELDAIENGYNYLPGPSGVRGLAIKKIPKDQLVLAIQEGADKQKLMELFSAGYRTIKSRMRKYSLGSNIQEARDMLVKPFILIGAEYGLTRSQVIEMMNENGITIFRIFKDPQGAITDYCVRIFQKSYDQLRKDMGGNPLHQLTVASPIIRNLFTVMKDLKQLGEAAEILGFNDKFGEEGRSGSDYLSEFCKKISGKSYTKLQDSLFWHSVRHILMTNKDSRFGGTSIAYELGLIDENTDSSVKERYRQYFRRYVPRYFNGMSISEAKRFYSTNYLGDY